MDVKIALQVAYWQIKIVPSVYATLNETIVQK